MIRFRSGALPCAESSPRSATATSSRSSSRGCGVWNTAATTRAASPSTSAAASGARAARRASPSSPPTSPPSTSKARRGSRTHAGRRTARRSSTTRIRTFSPGPRKAAAEGDADSGEAGGIAAAGRIGLIHNGIIENHDELRDELKTKGYAFETQTDTEVIAHLIDHLNDGDLLDAVQRALPRLRGAYAIAVISRDEPHRVVGARHGSPLVLGVGSAERPTENFLASDAMALAGVTDKIVYLEEGDVVDLQLGKHWISHADEKGTQRRVERPVKTVIAHSGAAELGPYRHYMQKEIFEQPKAIADTLDAVPGISPELFGDGAYRVFKDIESVLILACGTSYYSGSVAKYWLESFAGIPTQVEVASEYRYRDSVPNPRTLVVTISQSGETADTLAALKHARGLGMAHTLTVCNVATSAIVRESAMTYITRAGVEIGVASTKAFTTQLVGLFLLTLALAQVRGRLSDEDEAQHLKALRHLPVAVQAVLALEPQIIAWSEEFASKENALFSAAACTTRSRSRVR
jgi:glucosamine--fructose-6-phosphate aminotransferase (isomerizing)